MNILAHLDPAKLNDMDTTLVLQDISPFMVSQTVSVAALGTHFIPNVGSFLKGGEPLNHPVFFCLMDPLGTTH